MASTPGVGEDHLFLGPGRRVPAVRRFHVEAQLLPHGGHEVQEVLDDLPRLSRAVFMPAAIASDPAGIAQAFLHLRTQGPGQPDHLVPDGVAQPGEVQFLFGAEPGEDQRFQRLHDPCDALLGGQVRPLQVVDPAELAIRIEDPVHKGFRKVLTGSAFQLTHPVKSDPASAVCQGALFCIHSWPWRQQSPWP